MLQTCILQNEDLIVTFIVLATIKTAADSEATAMTLLFYAMNTETFAHQSCALRMLFVMILVSTSNQYPQTSTYTYYELIYTTDVTTELTGSITMFCRTSTTAENIPLNEVKFWLNRTTYDTHDPSLRQRTDINVLAVDNYRIKFNLTRSLEGYYTCGKCIDENCVMSTQKELICKYIRLHSYYSSNNCCIQE